MIKSYSEPSLSQHKNIRKIPSLNKILIESTKDDDNVSLNVNISSYSYLYENVYFNI